MLVIELTDMVTLARAVLLERWIEDLSEASSKENGKKIFGYR